MPIKNVVCCDKCEEVIKANGIAVKGNIHDIDKNAVHDKCLGGGIIGNNFKDNSVVAVSYYCRSCFIEILFGPHYELKQKESVILRDRCITNGWL